MMASVQELRYAGRRFAQILEICHGKSASFSKSELQELETHLIEAIQNCIKARHDALDAAVHFIHKRISALISSVGLPEVRAHFPNFNLLENEIKAIDRKIIEARADRSKLDVNYDAILVQHREKLIKFYKELESSEFAIRRALLSQRNINLRRLAISSVIGFFLGIISSVIASNIDRAIVGKTERTSESAASEPAAYNKK